MRKTEREKARTLLDRYKKLTVRRQEHGGKNETFRDSNYEVIWANGQSPSSKEHRMTYGRTQGKNQIWLFVELLKKSSMKDHVLLRRNIFQSQETHHHAETNSELNHLVLTFTRGIYQLCEIKLAQVLSEFNLVRRDILFQAPYRLLLFQSKQPK
ncbi:unnamed protein product [Rhizophagus irregularis]|nr:unnamed protein product [Rhizophagus irregularis]